MKTVSSILASTLLPITGYGGGGQSANETDTLITVDVTKSYSKKKKLILQDFIDVEYVLLETTDNFLNQGMVMDVGRDMICCEEPRERRRHLSIRPYWQKPCGRSIAWVKAARNTHSI